MIVFTLFRLDLDEVITYVIDLFLRLSVSLLFPNVLDDWIHNL